MADIEAEAENIPAVTDTTPAELIQHTNRVLVWAEEILKKVNAQEIFESFEQGCRPLVRGGKRKQVYYIEVGTDDGKRTRIEVYSV